MFSDSVLTVAIGEIFLVRIFCKIGNSRHNIKLLVTGYVINYLTADCHMSNCKEGKWRGILTPWPNACCEFLNRPKPGLTLTDVERFQNGSIHEFCRLKALITFKEVNTSDVEKRKNLHEQYFDDGIKKNKQIVVNSCNSPVQQPNFFPFFFPLVIKIPASCSLF